MPTQEVEPAFKVQLRDNGNKENSSDIEVIYHQYGLDNIKHYRFYLAKAIKAASHEIKYLLSLDNSKYVDYAHNEVIPSLGKRLPEGLLDTDGDAISSNTEYRGIVISIPNDETEYLPSLSRSENALSLYQNAIISNYSKQLETAYGALATNRNGGLAMASYDIFYDLVEDSKMISSLTLVDSLGGVNEIASGYSALGGVAYDHDGYIYITDIDKAQLIRYNESGESNIISLDGIELQKPEGIIIDNDGVIYIADRVLGAIIRIENNNANIFANVGQDLRGLTMDNAGNFYASVNNESGQIFKISPEGEVTKFAIIPTYKPEDYQPDFIMWMGQIAFLDNMLYVASTSKHQIYSITLDGEVNLYAGSGEKLLPYGDIKTARFNRPFGISFSTDGKSMYVSGCEDTHPSHTQASTPSRIYKIDM